MDQKVIIRFWWQSRLSSASRNHLTTFCRPFVHYACLRLCSAIVHFMRNNQGRTQGWGLVIPPWAWYFTKTIIPAERVLIIFAYLLLV